MATTQNKAAPQKRIGWRRGWWVPIGALITQQSSSGWGMRSSWGESTMMGSGTGYKR